MISPEGEHVTFLNLLSIGSDNNVNELLKNIERGMIENVRTFIKIAFEQVRDEPDNRAKWLFSHPA